ncbi:hypothetical protein [Pseudoalteromonas rubra]|uniref:hypothetical protein n=1 Tax=Pseudoalteromonas rubra TaxID=43658 RepID=UPI000F77B04F|nr:hypothetical protein [Pseudoalteromonas rubra]
MLLDHNMKLSQKKSEILAVARRFDAVYGQAAQESIGTIKSQLIEAKEKLEMSSSQYHEIMEREGYPMQPSEDAMELVGRQAEYYYDTHILEEQLLSLVEMKVVSLFKNFEIVQKELISISYEQVNTRDLCLWDNVKAFFNSNGIHYGRIKGYDFVNQLRIVNNNIKHSSLIDAETQKMKIKEFQGLESFTYQSLDSFYNRIFKKTGEFLVALAESVVENLYDYDDRRLNEIVDEYAETMNVDTLKKLAKLLDGKAQKLSQGSKLPRHWLS